LATSPDFLLSRFSLQKGLRKVGLFSTPIRTSVGHFCTPMNAGLDKGPHKKIAKAGKASAYMSAKGQTQGIMLRKGDSGFMVERLQTALKQAGYYAPPINGVYGDDVENAVKDLQKAKSIIVDGIAGSATLQALGLD
ncbi:MAG: peptidoglycan-binding protein, partial [Desulfovibrio sp.]|nr:peptidoglycan-binding protein [Desulfovibrio sp.]